MTVDIEKMRFDMEEQRKARERDAKRDTRKFIIYALLATVAAVGSGTALGYFVTSHQPPPWPLTIIIQQQPPVAK